MHQCLDHFDVLDRSDLDVLLGTRDNMLYSACAKFGIRESVASCTLIAELGSSRVMHVVPGSEKNIKITTVEDIEMVKALMHTVKESWLK